MTQRTPTANDADRVTGRLRQYIERASEALRRDEHEGAPSLRSLHELQAWCDVLFAEVAGAGAITVIFVLDHILEEAFENLAGDFKYDKEADGMRRAFFARLGSGLAELANSDLSDPSAWSPVTDKVLTDYTDVLAELNLRQLDHIAFTGETP